jgi:hypothetical protein
MKIRPHLLPFAVLCCLMTSVPTVSAQILIFADGFETGDVSRWSASTGIQVPCGAGSALVGNLEGDLGVAPAGAFNVVTCLEMRNDGAIPREPQVASAGIPIPEALALTATDSLLLVGPGGRHIAAQFDVLSRWGGRTDDTALPIRWLEVSTPARVAAAQATTYTLRRYAAPPVAIDAYAASIVSAGNVHTIDTGLATFVLDATNPAFIQSIAIDLDDDGVGRQAVYTHSAGAGPRLTFIDSGTNPVNLDTATPGQVVVDPGSFRIVETGPVKVVAMLRGHFSDAPAGESLCVTNGGSLVYERFAYSVALTFTRGKRDVGIQFHLRNECSDAQFEPWTDDSVRVSRASWEFPFALGTATHFYAGASPTAASVAGYNSTTTVEQRVGAGAGSNWVRRARVLHGAITQDAQSFAEPLAAVGDATLLVAGQIPWMHHREPQAIVIDSQTVSLRFVSESLGIGEAKGLWNFARLHLRPTALLGGPATGYLDGVRSQGTLELERPLLVRATREHVNNSLVLPSLGTDAPSALKTAYGYWMNLLHGETVDPGGQFDRNKTYGSQLWPDTGSSDPFGVDVDNPYETSSGMNYWDPAGNELLEYLRTGDPKWLWDFAIQGYWTQMHAAYMNIGEQIHGNRSGVAVTSGGQGCDFSGTSCDGHWHRSAFGSDDYTYDQFLELSYALRPNPLLLDRFRQAGANVLNRYNIPQADEDDREQFVNQVDITRQVIQHFEMLANCAEFVPAAAGQACLDKLNEVVDELAEDNMPAGLMCQGDAVSHFPAPDACFSPQQFMINALMYQFFHRYWRNYGDPPSGSVRAMLVGFAQALYDWSLPKLPDGVNIDVDAFPGFGCDELTGDGCWWAGLGCTLSADGSTILNCVALQDSDNNFFVGEHTRPHTLAIVMMGHEIEPSLGLCGIVRTAYEALDSDAAWSSLHYNQAGWWKGVAQMMQSMAFGLGVYDTCSDP